MIKKSILFLASTGALIYFITPSGDSNETEAPAEVANTTTKAIAQPSAESWGDEDGAEDEYENFTFGQPVTEQSGDEDEAWEEPEPSDRQDQWAGNGPSAPSVTTRSVQTAPDSPAPGEPGSLDNPIVFKTKTPANPIDDD